MPHKLKTSTKFAENWSITFYRSVPQTACNKAGECIESFYECNSVLSTLKHYIHWVLLVHWCYCYLWHNILFIVCNIYCCYCCCAMLLLMLFYGDWCSIKMSKQDLYQKGANISLIQCAACCHSDIVYLLDVADIFDMSMLKTNRKLLTKFKLTFIYTQTNIDIE